MMRYLDIINEEGAFNVTSDNGLVVANVTDIHPELIMEDNSMVIFDSIGTYYDLIGDANMFSDVDNTVNIESLMASMVSCDTVTDFSYKAHDINIIFEIDYNGNKIYYIQRTGLNPLSV